jgi:hypothetical protein
LKESFLQAVSGQIGKNNVSDYMQLLRDAGELCDDSYFKLLFRQSLSLHPAISGAGVASQPCLFHSACSA